MSQFEDSKMFTQGQVHVRVYSETQGESWQVGCLERVGFRFSKELYEIICDGRDGPIDWGTRNPMAEVFFDMKEWSVLNLLAALGDSSVSGSDFTSQVLTGPGEGNPSIVTDPAEWHIVKLDSATGPWTFSLYSENRDLVAGTGNWDVYTTGNTNGDVSVAVWAMSTGGSVALDDWRMGKFTFTTVPDADISDWSYDESSAPFTINGVFPIVEDDVEHGDSVCLIGLTYSYAYAEDTAGAAVDATERQMILQSLDDIPPVSLKLVHFLTDNRNRKALIWRFWKCTADGGADFSAAGATTNDLTHPARFRVFNDKENHPESPFFTLEKITSSVDLDLETLI